MDEKRCGNCLWYRDGWCAVWPPVLVREVWDIPRVVSTSLCSMWETKKEEKTDDLK